ncbi:MAG: YbaK/EbsC family protein [Gemmatimonadetes bacterium]|nr:YbaK/EbsC family protein [Gemmatimonadota bacterium]
MSLSSPRYPQQLQPSPDATAWSGPSPEAFVRARERLEKYLSVNGVQYAEESHRRAYTAQHVAALEHVPGQQFAKVVMLIVDGRPVMAVVPATRAVHFDRVAMVLGAHEVRLACESEFAPLFPDCEVGAMPPFGNLYCVPVYVDESLARNEEIVIQAGTHRDSIRLRYFDFSRLAQPVVALLSS